MRTLNAIRDLVEEVPLETERWPEVLYKHRGVQPPSALYVTQDDFLRVSVFTTASTSGLTLGLRIMGADGQVRRDEESLDGVSLSTLTTKVFGLREGFLLGVAVSNLGGGLADGACFVSVGLQFGSGTRAPYQILAQDYVTNLFSVEWPAAAVRYHPPVTTYANGTPLSIQVTQPAAGAEWIFTVPASVTYTVKSLAFTLVTAAGGGNRFPQVAIDDGTNVLFRSDANYQHAAATTLTWGGGSGVTGYFPNSTRPSVTLPTDMALLPGWRIGSSGSNLQAADQYSAISLAVIKWG